MKKRGGDPAVAERRRYLRRKMIELGCRLAILLSSDDQRPENIRNILERYEAQLRVCDHEMPAWTRWYRYGGVFDERLLDFEPTPEEGDA